MSAHSSENILVEFWNFIEDPSVPKNLLRQLQHLFKNVSLEGIELGLLPHAYPDSSTRMPHVLFVDQIKKLSEHTERSLQKMLSLDSHLVVVRVVREIPSGADVRAILSSGNQFFISTPTDLANARDSLFEILNARLKSHISRTVRVPARHKITVQIASLEQAIVAETLNIGRGGLFIRGTHPDIKKDDVVEFELEIHSQLGSGAAVTAQDPIETLTQKNSKQVGEHPHFKGLGTVAWIRHQAESARAPEGLGIRFQTLSPEIQKLINKYLQNSKQSIPES